MAEEFIAIDFETRDDGTPWQLGAARFEGGSLVETRDWRFGSETNPADRSVRSPWLTEEIIEYLQGKVLVAHNIACEKTLLTKAAPITKWGPWEDTLKIAKKRYPGLKSYALSDLCQVFGIDLGSLEFLGSLGMESTGGLKSTPAIEGRTWHDGLYDAIACALLYMRIR